ncbi:SusC/RagA family TonB-linked outer membrane protein [Membranihabitans marinus]|uniref:SusC/RagA family TonB-linked outer membrane protein n=1 Tax=Membranihabitans marinus TaxID=1227546 RepID=UPI001F2610A8|nr:TonB-dependent receptor [Membranihabitans marinus]
MLRTCLLLIILMVSSNQFLIASSKKSQSLEDIWITIEISDKGLESIIKKIEKQTQLTFAYLSSDINKYKHISVKPGLRNVKIVLEQALVSTDLGYQYIENSIILFPKKLVERNEIDFDENKENFLVSSINNFSQRLRTESISVLKSNNTVIISNKIIVADVSGRVVSQEGEPLIGVNVLLKNKNIGTATDFEGRFILNDVDENDVLVFSYIGYQTIEVPLDGRRDLTVVLEEDSQTLDQVVVVGYGTQKKVNLIGSVSVVSEKEILTSPVPNISNALSGRIPGLTAQQGTGEPGNNQSKLLIRGTATLGDNSPLVIIDGVQGRDLNSINPNDISSISVLKDASAAIYGARAANGVILVSTKSGDYDAKPTFNYRFYEGLKSPTKLPEMASSFEYASMIREVQSYRGIDESNMTFSQNDIEKYKSGDFLWTHPNTNWYEEALSDYSRIGNHNFSVNGGSSNIKYYLSFGTLNEGGIYSNSGTNYNRINIQGKMDVKINEYINVGLNINGVKGERESSVKSAYNVFSSVIRNYPYKHAVFPGTDKPGPDIEYGDQPIVTPSFEPGFVNDNNYTSNNIISASFKIPNIEGLRLDAFYSFDKTFDKLKIFEKPYTLYSFDDAAYIAVGNTGVENGEEFLIPYRAGTVSEPRLTDQYSDSKATSLNVKAEYSTTFSDIHNLHILLAYENGRNEAQGISAFRRFFNSDKLPYLFAGGDAQKDNNGWASLDSRVNFISRINYDIADKYLFQFGLRRDGSLRFSKESGRWGNFPSLLAGWRISEEDWWKSNINVIDEFKLKASWAKMGNDLIPPFQYLTSFGFGTGIVSGSGAEYSPALYQSGSPNPQITWEVANVYNFGIESYFFNYNLSMELELFYEKRNNILVKRNASVPYFTGLNLPDENFGIVENRGVELVLGYRNRVQNFKYDIRSSVSFARNKVVEFDEPERSVPWQVLTGKPQGSQLLYRFDGIFRDITHVESLPHVPGARPGDIIIKDIDGDGNITADDRELIPLTSTPELTYGFNINLNYKNLGLSFFIHGVENAIKYVYSDERQGTAGNYFKYDAIDRWTPDNINGSKPRAFEKVEEYWRQAYLTDYSFHELGFARLKNVQLSYELPNNIAELIKFKGVSIYLSGQNLFLLYNRNPIFDPEVSSARDYPLMKTFSLGGNFTF